MIIIVHQLPDLLGVHAGGGSTVHRISTVVSHLGHVSVMTLVIGLGVFAHGAPRLGLSGVSWATIEKLAPLAGVWRWWW